jgi:hypothetical protein
VPREQLPELATFHSTGHARVSDGTRVFDLTPEEKPTLHLELTTCVAWSRRDLLCHDSIDAHLTDVSLVGARLTLRDTSPHAMFQDIELDHVRSAALDFHAWRKANWNPTLGFGVAFGGPVSEAAAVVQVIPAPWFALEIGGGIPDDIDIYTGFRVRPLVDINPKPFVGGFIGAAYGPHDASAAGPRAGIDFEFDHRTMLFTLEADYARALKAPYDAQMLVTRHWFLWGGATFTYFL